MFEERASLDDFWLAVAMRDEVELPTPTKSWSQWEDVKWNLRAARDAADR